ncbi:hypothetical protein AB0P17_24435 [Streptomyces sp. NPDC088124]|uniref:hypothetical protein n=1 Tax=Streptomyces sp. NPDC088124 TaxID=3154654 RepID=UPI00343050EF
MPNRPSYRHLARTGRRIEADITAEPIGPATDRLPDAEALIRRSHDERLTGAELARDYETSTRTVYAALKKAGRSREGDCKTIGVTPDQGRCIDDQRQRDRGRVRQLR